MKLIKAEISGFGHYRQRTFDFLSGNQLFFGNNETGKSTLYHFIQTMLFGFPKKNSRKRDYQPQDGAAYGGKLWIDIAPHGEILVERYQQKNRGQAKVYLGNQEGNEELLKDLLTPLTLETFQEVFTFQQEQLTAVDHLQETELHNALISLGITGSQQWMGKIAEYKKENDKLYKRRAHKPELNQRLNEWQKLKEIIHEQESQEARIQSAYQQLSSYQKKQADVHDALNQLQVKLQALRQQEHYWSLYEEWQELQQIKFAQNSIEEQNQLKHFYQEYQQLTEEIQKKEDELARLEQGQESDRYFFYLDHEAEIQELLRQEVQGARLSDEKQRLVVQQAKIGKILEETAHKWGWRSVPDELDDQVYELLDRLEELQKQTDQQRARIQWLEERVQLLEAEITQLEKKHPEWFKTSKTSPISIVSIVAGILLLIVAWFTPILKSGFLLLGSGLIIGGMVSIFYSPKKQKTTEKSLWQEKLVQLDGANHEWQTESDKLAEMQAELEQLINYLQPSFGNNTNYLSWRQTLVAYQQATNDFRQQTEEMALLEEQQKLLVKEINKLVSQFESYHEWLPLGNKELSEKFTLLADFANQMNAIKMTRLQQPSTLLAQQLKRSKESRQALFKEHQTLFTTFGLDRPADIPWWIKRWEEEQKQIARKTELTQLLQEIFPEKIQRQELSNQMMKTENQVQQFNQEMTEVLEEKQRVQLQIENLQNSGTLDELYQTESRLLSEIEELAVTWSTNQVMMATLNDLATELSEQQLPQLIQQASYYFAILTNDRYQQVVLKEGILHVSSKQELVNIYTLSTGTKDQLIMAIRFAYLSLQEGTSACPVMIDDGWLHYDSQRKANLAKLLATFGEKHQVICLSSDKEMVSYYQEIQQPVTEIQQRM